MPDFSNHWKTRFGTRDADSGFQICSVLAGLCMFALSSSFAGEPPRHGIVSLAPNLTELIHALGFGTQLVARSTACDFPPGVKSLPVAGDFGRPNLEAIERLRPDLVIFTDVENPAAVATIRQRGIGCLKLSCEGWTNLLAAADQLGHALGDTGRTDAWKKMMIARREKIRAQADAEWRNHARPRVYAEIWRDPLTTAGAGSFLDDLISLAGGINIARELRSGYPHVSPEWILRENPDAIVLLYMLQGGREAADVKSRTGWGGMKAVANGAICTNIPPDLLLRSGPRCLDGAEMLAAWLQRL